MRKKTMKESNRKDRNKKVYILNEKFIGWPYHQVKHHRRKGQLENTAVQAIQMAAQRKAKVRK